LIYNILTWDSDLNKTILLLTEAAKVYYRRLHPISIFTFKNRIFVQNIRFMTTFNFNLPKSVQKAIDDLGFTTPTYSGKNFSVIMSGRDMMGIAQTGNW
jgi:superfamily II DNA/RNA helicase